MHLIQSSPRCCGSVSPSTDVETEAQKADLPVAVQLPHKGRASMSQAAQTQQGTGSPQKRGSEASRHHPSPVPALWAPCCPQQPGPAPWTGPPLTSTWPSFRAACALCTSLLALATHSAWPAPPLPLNTHQALVPPSRCVCHSLCPECPSHFLY